MRYRLRTLMTALALATLGCAQTPPDTIALHVVQPVVAAPIEPASGPATVLDWTDLDFMVEDRSKFDLAQLPDRVRALDGKRVRVRGYFHLGITAREVREFLLLGEIGTRPTVSKFGLLPDEWPIHQLAAVEMSPGNTAEFTLNPVAVTGRLTFSIVEWDGKPILVFRIIADSVEPVQRRSGYGPCVVNGC